MSSSQISALAPQQQALRVLHVEDNPQDARLCCRQLEKAGFMLSIDVVATAKQFQSSLRSNLYDLILADYNLPSFSGMGALNLLQRDGRASRSSWSPARWEKKPPWTASSAAQPITF
jgi:CheY-like chemotaxis protein